MRLRNYEYKIEEKLVRTVRGTRFRPRQSILNYRVVGSGDFASDWFKRRSDAVNILRQKGATVDKDIYTIDFNPEAGTITIKENPIPDPKVSYRVKTSAENNDIYYSVEEMRAEENEWKRIIHTPDHGTAIHKMLVIAEHNMLNEDSSDGLLIESDCEIIIIGKSGYRYTGRDVSEITGALVVCR